MTVSQMEHHPPQLPALGVVVHDNFFLCLLEVWCVLDCISVRLWDLRLVPLVYSPSSGPVILIYLLLLSSYTYLQCCKRMLSLWFYFLVFVETYLVVVSFYKYSLCAWEEYIFSNLNMSVRLSLIIILLFYIFSVCLDYHK